MKMLVELLICLTLVWAQGGLLPNLGGIIVTTVEELIANEDTLSKEQLETQLEAILPLLSNLQDPNLLIIPGTKWCGAGNTAASYDDLGFFRQTDSCCRTHDHCPDNIKSGETKYGLTNDGISTRNLCSCDEALYNCLKGVNTADSTLVGVLFFDVLAMKCFEEDYPISGCLEHSTGFFKDRCVEYEFDDTKPKVYEWFDPKEYLYPELFGSK